MAFPRVRASHLIPPALVAVAALLPAGCGGNEGVTKYDVPKEEGKKESGYVPEGDYRILGAMFPADNPEWFFKLPGRADDLAKYEADFDKLITSVSLPGDGPPKFTAPEGWVAGPGRGGVVVATIRTPDGKHEVTVTPSAGGVLGNLKRWATDSKQPGGKGFEAGDIPKVTRKIEAKGVSGLRVDLRGPHNPASKGGPMMPPGHP
jgi:hypothetical protein